MSREVWSATGALMPDQELLPDDLKPPFSRSDGLVPRVVLRPLQEFLQTSSAGALFLLVAVAVALIWANAPGSTYERFWHAPVVVRAGGWTIVGDLRDAVNEGLMTLFFLLVGLEIKREFMVGELRDRRAAVLPVLAAIGGMVLPALLYMVINAGGPAAHGWGIPMATDVAFALALLTLAARSAPANLKPFLLTLAIVDDIGAILVIAIFYSGGVSWGPLIVVLGLSILILALQRIDVRATWIYLALGFLVWYATYRSGLHPTIAGVLLGFLTPGTPFQSPIAVSEAAHRIADGTDDDPSTPDADSRWWLALSVISREAVSPLARVEHILLPWSSFVILPLFALANAGIEISSAAFRAAATSPVAIGVVVGLVLGKLMGISACALLGARLGLGRLPHGATTKDLGALAATAGIGFTVALFIADLAFEDPKLLEQAKDGILVASLIAGILGYLMFRLGTHRRTG